MMSDIFNKEFNVIEQENGSYLLTPFEFDEREMITKPTLNEEFDKFFRDNVLNSSVQKQLGRGGQVFYQIVSNQRYDFLDIAVDKGYKFDQGSSSPWMIYLLSSQGLLQYVEIFEELGFVLKEDELSETAKLCLNWSDQYSVIDVFRLYFKRFFTENIHGVLFDLRNYGLNEEVYYLLKMIYFEEAEVKDSLRADRGKEVINDYEKYKQQELEKIRKIYDRKIKNLEIEIEETICERDEFVELYNRKIQISELQRTNLRQECDEKATELISKVDKKMCKANTVFNNSLREEYW